MRLALALLSSVCAASASAQDAATLQRLDEIGPAVFACWRPPAGTAGSSLTVVFSFNKSGVVFGKPRITFSKLTGDAASQQAFVASVLDALKACTPLHLSDALGGAVAGRPFSLRFAATARQEGV